MSKKTTKQTADDARCTRWIAEIDQALKNPSNWTVEKSTRKTPKGGR